MRARRVLSLIAFGVAVALVLLEVGLRLTVLVNPSFGETMKRKTNSGTGIDLLQWDSHPFLPFIGHRGLQYTTQGDHGVFVGVKNNNEGFRTHEFPTTKQPNDRFIVCLGESTTWGSASVTNAATWPELLEAKLAARYPSLHFQVFNLGAPTGTTTYSVTALALLGIRLHPDLLIVYHGANEYGAMMSNEFRYDHSHYYYNFNPSSAWLGVRRSLPPIMLSSYAIAYIAGLIDSSLHVDTMGFHIVRETPRVGEFPNRGTQATLENLSTMAAIAKGEGAETLFSTFQFYDGKHQNWVKLNGMLRDFFREKGLWYVDQDELLPDYDRSINIDDVHFTRKGDELMADNFFNAIVERGTFDRSPANSEALPTGFQ